MTRGWLSAVLVFAVPLLARAHPVPKGEHDRHITVRLRTDTQPGHLLLQVAYRLEVDEDTVFLDDMRPFYDKIDLSLFRKNPLAFHAKYAEIYAPILAGNLIARVNGKDLLFKCTKFDQRLQDEGKPLGHLRCDFSFEASFPAIASAENVLTLREGNFLEQEGQISLHWANEASLKVLREAVPNAEIQKTPQKIEHDKLLRELAIHFQGPSVESTAAAPKSHDFGDEPSSRKDTTTAQSSSEPGATAGESLLHFFRRTDLGFFLLLLIFMKLGAVHALTPGHGKTLVAAYLVGQRGTVAHAVFLGVMTTLTHTGVVLLLAIALLFLPDGMSASAKQAIHTGLGLVMGLIVACLGFWLLLQRLSGRADHFHIGGHHHRHHHGHGHEHDHHPGERADGGVSWWGLALLGITGGLIPCWDAVIILVASVGAGEFGLAFPLILAFSAGLAGTLVLIGIMVVKLRHFAGSRWGNGRLVRALPIVSALFITAVGIWLCYESLQMTPHH